MAEQSKKALDDSGKFERPAVTRILPYTTFYPAEEYHQDYARRYPGAYRLYRTHSGREAFIQSNWQRKNTH